MWVVKGCECWACVDGSVGGVCVCVGGNVLDEGRGQLVTHLGQFYSTGTKVRVDLFLTQ